MTTGLDAKAQNTTGAFEEFLTPDVLSALMRSTWTWDDRALRRDLSVLLVELEAAKRRANDDAITETLQARAWADGARFAAVVLGPALVADTGNPLRGLFVDAATDPARFTRDADRAFGRLLHQSHAYVDSYLKSIPYLPETQWQEAVHQSGQEGLSLAMRAYGSLLSDSTFFASAGLAWQVVNAVQGSADAGDFAAQLASGRLTATLAAAEASGSWDPAMVRTRAVPGEGGWHLTGAKFFVPGADQAEFIFVIARSDAGPSLFAVRAGSPGVASKRHAVIDQTRPLFEVTFTDTPAQLLGVEGGGGRLMSEGMDLAVTALAGEQVGLIETAIATLRGHTEGEQDSDIRRRLAELALDHAAAEALWRYAVVASTPEAAAMAHVGCSSAAVRVTTAVADLCGPNGESSAILCRALSGNLLFGGPAVAHERLLERLGI